MIILCSGSAPSDEVTANPSVINQAPVVSSSAAPATGPSPRLVISQESVASNENDIILLKSSLRQSLSTLATSLDYPSANQIKDAAKMAGAKPKEIEISPVETPTGLRADSIEVAFVIDAKECLFGYIRGKDVSTSVLPILSNGRCMIGATS